MHGNPYASGLTGSDTTTANPPPAARPTVTTHNQPQLQFPPGTVAAAAAIQNHRDDPHLAGNEACLCSSCHLRGSFFPRNQDGRIVLPHPSLFIHSARFPRPTTTTTNIAPLATPVLATRKRSRTESTVFCDLRLSVAKFNEGRRGGESRTPHLPTDKGEGSSTGAGRMSGNIGDSCTTLPHRSNREIISTGESDHSPRMSRRGKSGGRSFSVPSRRTHLSKRHNQNPKKPDPWPRAVESDEFAGQPNHLTQQSFSSQHSQPLDKLRRTKLESSLDRHGITHPQNFLQTFQARGSSHQTAKLETPPSTTPSTAPQYHSDAYGYEHHPTRPPLYHDEPGLRTPSYPESSGRLDTPYHHHHHDRHYPASGPESPTDTADATQDKPKIIRFSSSSENPQPLSIPDATSSSGEKSVNSSPTTRDPPQSSPSSSHQLQSEGSSRQTQFQFQDPVVPEDHITSPIRPRELSIVHVKWDSERKRRQGYFSQEEGAEKSPFRHYNKANCDLDS